MLCEKLHLLNSPQTLENQNYFGLGEHHSLKKDLNLMNLSSESFISNPNLIFKTSSLLFILEIIFTNNRIIAIEQLKSIIPFLACEFSPCIQKSFLLIFLKIFSSDCLINSYNFSQKQSSFSAFSSNAANTNNINNPNHNNITGNNNINANLNRDENFQNFNLNNFFMMNNYDDFNYVKKDPAYFIDDSIRTKYISVFLKNKGLEHVLAISSISTLDVRIECVKIFDIFSRLSSVLPYNMEEQLIPFIANSIFPLKTPLNDYNGVNLNNFISAQALSDNFCAESKNMNLNEAAKKRRKFNNEVYIDENNYNNLNSSNERKKFRNILTIKDDSKLNFKSSVISDLLETDEIVISSSKARKKSLSDLENEEALMNKQACFKKDISNITPIAKVRDSPKLRLDSKMETLKISSQNEKNEDEFYESN